jgi:hypothetical protein
MAEDIGKLQRQRAQAEAANDAGAVARFDARIKAATADQQMGPPSSAAPDQQVNPTWDVVQSVGTGLRSAAEGTIGTPGDIAGLGRAGVSKLAQFMGADPETVRAITEYDIPYVPDVSSESVHELTTPFIGESYQPQTTVGKYGRAAAEYMPLLFNPLKAGSKIAKDVGTGLLSGVASEAAGQATEGTALEPWARAGAGMGTSVAAGGAQGFVEGRSGQPRRQAEIAAEDAAGEHGVRLTRGQLAGAINAPNAVKLQQAEQEMMRGVHGNYAQEALLARKREQEEAIRTSGDRLASDIAPARGQDPVQSGGLLNERTRSRAEDLMDTGGKKIQDAINEGVIVDTARLKGLPAELEGKLTGVDPYIPDVVIDASTPMAQKAKNQIDAAVKKYTDNPAIIDESMGSVERLRRSINNMQADTPEDRRAMKALMKGFDEWYDDVVTNDATVAKTGSQYSIPSARDPADILADLRGGRSTFREGAEIARPRGKDRGSTEVAKIATEGTLPEETARLFKPNDRGDMSSSSIKTIERLKKVGATSEDLDQVRGIVLDTLLKGDPGKVTSRIDNFIRNNPSAANGLFTPEQLERLKNWKKTNKALVPEREAINPPQSSYGPMREMIRAGTKGAMTNAALIGAILGQTTGAVVGGGLGAVGAGVQAGKKAFAAKTALQPADRRSVSQFAIGGGASGARKALPPTLQAGRMMTIDDPGGEDDGKRGKIVSVGKDGITLRMPDGTTRTVGKKLVRED